ncbi:multiheme c-type cytochrome [Flagellimonas crocea]|uniref:multiheme c-type cytochrome n=1 Tax=Flagellimonas crocea TaxID=3067311 RepID=UPI00296EA715|nr:multiheme c-type cytochrome [Muricauda sp. DH64]
MIFDKIFDSKYESAYYTIEPVAIHANGEGFSGSRNCIGCHKDIYLTHIKTAHFQSSRIADSISIQGNFENENSFLLNDEIIFFMRSRKDGFYQEAFSRRDGSLVDSKRIDIVIGSGTKGQSYLNWQGDDLYQLQISYFGPSESWVNSPGYPNGIFAPNRPIRQRCLECHVTFAKSRNTFNKPHSYDRSQFMYGIDCERCHGPAVKHVNYHLSKPSDAEAKNILSFSDLNQKQKLQSCALCHSGIRRKTSESPFSFMTGDTLADFPNPEYDSGNLESLDVHGNQYGLLLASLCFKESKNMDCTSCHDPHKNQRGDLKDFNAKCIICHRGSFTDDTVPCSLELEIGKPSNNNCVECHMPLTPSKSMSIYDSKDSLLVPVKVRTHLIDIYK